MIPAICVGVDEETGTCSVMEVELIQNEDGTVTSKYKGKKITGLIYTWQTPVREDLTIVVSGNASANGNYTLEDEYNFENDRVWINETNETYNIRYNFTNNRWELYSDLEAQTSVAYETTASENPFGSSTSWTNSVVCSLA